MKGSRNGGRKMGQAGKEGKQLRKIGMKESKKEKLMMMKVKGRTMAGKQLSVWKRSSRRRRKEIKIDSRKRGLRP